MIVRTKRWRIVRNEWNLKGAPWGGAVGIEEDDPNMAVPAVVCWFTRGWEMAMIQDVVDAHNAGLSDGKYSDFRGCGE